MSHASASNCRPVARTRLCSGVSHAASCRQAHKPRGCVPRRAADTADQPRTRCITSCLTPISPDGTSARVSSPDVQKIAAECMIRVRDRLDYIGRETADAYNRSMVIRNGPRCSNILVETIKVFVKKFFRKLHHLNIRQSWHEKPPPTPVAASSSLSHKWHMDAS